MLRRPEHSYRYLDLLVLYLVVYTSTGYRLPVTGDVCNVRNVVGGLDVEYYY